MARSFGDSNMVYVKIVMVVFRGVTSFHSDVSEDGDAQAVGMRRRRRPFHATLGRFHSTLHGWNR